nr:hypothetical protein [Tanacetum cinerariifolium]
PEAEGADVELKAEEPDGESSTARDPQRNLEALHRHERLREAESETSRTEVGPVVLVEMLMELVSKAPDRLYLN